MTQEKGGCVIGVAQEAEIMRVMQTQVYEIHCNGVACWEVAVWTHETEVCDPPFAGFDEVGGGLCESRCGHEHFSRLEFRGLSSGFRGSILVCR